MTQSTIYRLPIQDYQAAESIRLCDLRAAAQQFPCGPGQNYHGRLLSAVEARMECSAISNTCMFRPVRKLISRGDELARITAIDDILQFAL